MTLSTFSRFITGTLVLGIAGCGAGPEPQRVVDQSSNLIGGSVTPESTRQEFGLLALNIPGFTCSASLLTNNWAITASHCVENQTTGAVVPPATVTLTATWGGGQSEQGLQIISFRPYDVAIVRVANPFVVFGNASCYSRQLFSDGQFPYFGSDVPVTATTFGRGISQLAQGSGASATPTVNDGQYRRGSIHSQSEDSTTYTFTNELGVLVAGGDSGGPTFAWVLGGYALMGVHSSSRLLCLPGAPTAWTGQTCGTWQGTNPQPSNYNPWMWVSSIISSSDARIAPIANQISASLTNVPACVDPNEVSDPPPYYVGTFGTTPPNYQPILVYAVQDDGVLMWYRKDTGDSPWQGPKPVGSGWADFQDVISAGANNFYGLTSDGRLMWYRHDGFNDGSFAWTGPIEVGQGWTFQKIFSGGDGVVYAITTDGTLLWYKHNGFRYGGGIDTWTGPLTLGTGWGQFKDIFSNGNGAIYAVQQNGDLLLCEHDGYETGALSWAPAPNPLGATQATGTSGGIDLGTMPKTALADPSTVCRAVGTQWDQFRQIVPASNGVLLAIQADGTLLYYKDRGPTASPYVPSGLVEQWDGPLPVGTGWQGFKKVVASLPASPTPPS